MPQAVQNIKALHPGSRDEGQEMIGRLNQSFEPFIGITEDLKTAYDRLRERADAMDLKLKQANVRLSEKVRELDALTRRLNDLLQNLPSAVIVEDGSGHVTHFNRAAERLLGVQAEEAVGLRLEGSGAFEGVLLLSGGSAGGHAGEERSVLIRDGRRLVVTSCIADLEDAAGRPAGRIEILTDLTETDRLRKEVHRLDTLAAMGEMAAAVAHQIRNPLNGVEGFASLLVRLLEQGEPSARDALRYARYIVQGVRDVNAVIHGMLMLARSEPLRIQPVSLDGLVRETLKSLEPYLDPSETSAEIELRCGAEEVWVHGDHLKLKQVCLNLVHNAIEAMRERGPGRIRISTRRQGDRAELRVADTGRGFDPETAGKVFQPFFTTRDNGIGLGLSVAAKIADLHGGRLAVRSIPGTGTVFKLTLTGPDPVERKVETDDGTCARCR